ncbi:hypothetical protein NUACC21_72980 [Scytonema sp. NUACC21]
MGVTHLTHTLIKSLGFLPGCLPRSIEYIVVFYTLNSMREDPRIQLWKKKLGIIAEAITNKEQEVVRKQMQLHIIQQERDNLQTEIVNLISEAESIQKRIHELGG